MIATRNELGKLESIILFDLSGFIERKFTVDPDLLVRFKTSIDSEVERIKFSFVNSTATLEKKSKVEAFVQYHEHGIIHLSNALNKYVAPTKMQRPSGMDTATLCRHLYDSLQDLLDFIEQHYSSYVDPHAWIPECYHAVLVAEITRDLVKLRYGLTQAGFSSPLINQVLTPFETFVKSKTSKYHRVLFLKQLGRELLRHIGQAKKSRKPDDVPLLWTLFDMNFNSTSYYLYLTQRAREYYEAIHDTNERIDLLALSLKLMQQRRMPSRYAFEPDQKSIQEQLIQWMELELNFHRAQIPPATSFDEPATTDQPQRVKVDLSIAQLAYFIRLLIECAVLQQSNLTKLIRRIVQTFETKRSADPSPKRFEHSYYDVEQGTKRSVRAILEAMIQRVDADE